MLALPAITRHRQSSIVTAAAFLGLAGVQVVLPLTAGDAATIMTSVAVGLFAVVAISLALRVCSPRKVLLASLGVVVWVLSVEAIGVVSGFPFGEYEYTQRLRPSLLGVPVIVPLAWLAIAFAAGDVSRRLVRPGLVRCLLGGFLIMAWDVFLDPQMVDAGMWVWPGGGSWQGIPLSNYLGWFAVGIVAVAVVLSAWPKSDKSLGQPWLTLLYAWMMSIETVGFLLPFVFDDPIVGMVGGVLSLPLVVMALRRSPR